MARSKANGLATANGHSNGETEDAKKPLLLAASSSSSAPSSSSSSSSLPSSSAVSKCATSAHAGAEPSSSISSSSSSSRSTLQLLVALALDGVEAVLDYATWQDPASNKYLQGNFAPVAEAPAVDTQLKVTGRIPEYLRGEFFRVGPNPKFTPTAGYHLFDGDGLLHAVKFSPGEDTSGEGASGVEASYVSRFIRTSRFKQEAAYGRPMFVKLGEMRGVLGMVRMMVQQARGYFGLLNLKDGAGTANTALVFHGGSLQALHEGDMPYIVRVLADGELETVGRHSYGGALDHSLTAHPKVDPVTGELYTFSYNFAFDKAPHLIYRVVTASGKMGPKVPITISEYVMMHDFAITEGYAIFLDVPAVFDAKVMVTKGTIPFVWKDRPARFGVLPRNDTSEANIRWFQRPPLCIFHVANAWDEGDEVILFACRFDKLNLSDFDDLDPKLTEFRFNLKTGASSECRVSQVRCDFPRINDALVGRKCRYVYAAVIGDAVKNIIGIVKFDLSRERKLPGKTLPTMAETAEAECKLGGCAVGFFDLGPGRYGSEPVFVPRPGASPATAEDDGCLLTMVYDSTTNTSEALVLDAVSLSPVPLAVVHLNCRVPYGFHGTFVSQEQLDQQLEKDASQQQAES